MLKSSSKAATLTAVEQGKQGTGEREDELPQAYYVGNTAYCQVEPTAATLQCLPQGHTSSHTRSNSSSNAAGSRAKRN